VTNIVGGYDFEWDNSGDEIRLFDIAGNEILHMTYADSLAWPKGADGTGRTLELTNDLADMDLASSWFDGCIKGSPGVGYMPCNDALVFSEVNYNSAAAMDAGDWIEIWNTTTDAIDLSGWKCVDEMDSLIYTFEEGTVLESDDRLVLSGDLTLFTTRHPDVIDLKGPFQFGLDASGEEIRLFNEHGVLQFTMIYNDAAPWPFEADGGGKTLELENASGVMNDGNNWFAGCPEGSPGTVYDPDCDGVIAITELHENAITISPNPAHDITYIRYVGAEHDFISIQVCDMSGKIVQTSGTDQTILYRRDLPAGMYQIRFITEGKVITQMLIWQ
jgi:hypothetical protein